MREGAYSSAIEDYNYLLQKYKKRVYPLHFELAEALKLDGKDAAAKSHFDEVINYYSGRIESRSTNGKDYIYRGLAYAQIGEVDKAREDLQKGVELSPSNVDAHYNLGHLRLMTGKNKEAIEELDKALNLKSGDCRALLDRATAKIRLNDLSGAREDLDKALAVQKSVGGLLDRAIVRLRSGDAGGALSDVRSARKLNLASVEAKEKKLAAALGGSDSKFSGDLRQRVGALQLLAAMRQAAGDRNGAADSCRRSISMMESNFSKSDPQIAYGLNLLGRIYLENHDLLKAEALFRAASEKLKGSTNGAFRYSIFGLEDCAKAYLEALDLEEAGAILVDTRMARASSGLKEYALSGELSSRAEKALEAYKQRQKYDEMVRTAALLQKGPEPVVENEEVEPSRVVINKPIRDKWAIIVGISNFQDSKINLQFAAKDAQDFRDFLVNEKRFAPDHVQLLTDERATRANILSLLGSRWLPRLAEPDDLVVIYFSSHGSPSSLDVGGVNYLVAHDTEVQDLYATGIAMQDLARIIKERVHCDRIMLVLDACHSGVASPSSKSLVRSGNINVDRLAQGTGQLVISSSTPEQRSWESKRYEGSVFTHHLIDGLKIHGNDTTLGDAFKYLEQETRREVLRDRGLLQTPVLKSKWEGKSLILGVQPTRPSPALALEEFSLPDEKGESKSIKQKATAKK